MPSPPGPPAPRQVDQQAHARKDEPSPTRRSCPILPGSLDPDWTSPRAQPRQQPRPMSASAYFLRAASAPAAGSGSNSAEPNGLNVRCFRRPVLCGHVVLRRTGVRAGCGLLRSGVRRPVPRPLPRRNRCCLGGTAAARLLAPGRSCPLVGLSVDTDRSADRAVDSGCPRPVPITGQCPDLCRTMASCNGALRRRWPAVVADSRAGLTVHRTLRPGRFRAGGRAVRSVSARRGHRAAGVGRRRNYDGHPGPVPMLPSGTTVRGSGPLPCSPTTKRHWSRAVDVLARLLDEATHGMRRTLPAPVDN
jgi:hypothetical protein